MSPAAIEFGLVPGVRASSHRAVGFLQGAPELNAYREIMALGEKKRRYVFSSMDEWIGGQNRPKTRFHGFPNDKDYSMCFVFKAKDSRKGHRFYGYLYHAEPKSNPNFEICVLCIHATKNEWETDRSELARVKKWYSTDAAKEAIRFIYPDGGKGQARQWKN